VYSRLDHPRECAVGLLISRHHHQSGGVLVEAMDDPRPAGLAASEGVPQQVDQCLSLDRGRGVHHQASRFLDHRQVVVQVDDQTLRGQVVHSKPH
jgi:hypothetical protein